MLIIKSKTQQESEAIEKLIKEKNRYYEYGNNEAKKRKQENRPHPGL